MVTRDQLELVIQKKKIIELESWFNEHFANSSRADYINRCPILIIQGPTGSGKTTCLETIAKELKIQIREYSETTDITAIDTELSGRFDREERTHLSQSIDRRKASKFEHFVINNVRFNPLYPTDQDQPILPSADSEFEDDDDDFFRSMSKPPPPPSSRGVIIHVQTSLSFCRSHRIFIQSISRLIKTIKDISKVSTRRAAIVFEDEDVHGEIVSTLPAKFKSSLGIVTIKFNAITKANMRKFVDMLLRRNQNLIMDKDTIECIVNDCDGDISACINTIEFLRDGSKNFNPVYMRPDENIEDAERLPPLSLHSGNYHRSKKKQRLNHEMSRVHVNQILMRDMTRSVGFFHILGKIFYQKRLYPEAPSGRGDKSPRARALDRPFETENSSEFLVQQLDVNPKDLTAWLHQHYHKFCNELNIERAATMMENLSDVDTISINALQSSQFYEMHNHLDQLQLQLNIEATAFSLYQDQSNVTKTSHKKISTSKGTFVLKSSIENSSNGHGDLYSFTRPVSLMLPKVIQDNHVLLDHLTGKIIEYDPTCRDQTKVLIDYIPYLSYILRNIPMGHPNYKHPALDLLDDGTSTKVIKALECLEPGQKIDFDAEHEKLLELIEELDEKLGAGAIKKEIAEN